MHAARCRAPLCLRAGKAPTVEQYQEAHEELALPLSSQQVIRLAFEGGYEAFADSYNINLSTGIPPLVKVLAIRLALALTRNEALSVAHGQLDLAEAQQQARRRRERDRGVHNLVGTRDLVQMLDHSGQRLTAGTREPGLPVSVATIGLYRARGTQPTSRPAATVNLFQSESRASYRTSSCSAATSPASRG